MRLSLHFRLIIAVSSLLISHNGFGQVMATFENFGLKPGQYLNNASPNKGFQSGSIELPNFFDPEFQFWSGWAISADTNTTMPGFTNQYSSIAGGGAEGSATYATGFLFDPSIMRLQPNAIGKPIIGLYVSNSTYAYLSMLNGDSFAKKFGGETGTDPDFFMLTFRKYSGGVIADDSINVYLADYRSSDPSKDYILSDWKYVDLSVLGGVDSLQIQLRSSDNGIFGMNTPAYVCIDQVSTDNLLATSFLNRQGKQLTVHPNPANGIAYINLSHPASLAIYDALGIGHHQADLEAGQHQIKLSGWSPGIYFVMLDGTFSMRLMVE